MSTLEIICGTMGASKDEWNGSSANLTKMCMTTHWKTFLLIRSGIHTIILIEHKNILITNLYLGYVPVITVNTVLPTMKRKYMYIQDCCKYSTDTFI